MSFLKTVLFNLAIFKLHRSGIFLQFCWEFRRDLLWGQIICYLPNADFASPKYWVLRAVRAILLK